MLRSTFLGYKTATGAMKVNQSIMDVVGQNISNINTEGYTRQRLDISSVSINARNLQFGLGGVIIGQGVQANGVSQFRDAFLDLRYRLQAAKTGSQDVQLDALNDLGAVFDEISTDGIEAQFSDLLTQLQALVSSPSDPVMEGVVRTSAQMLTQMFNNYSQQINTTRNQQMNYLKDGAVVKVNQLMDNIAKLNQQIREDNISGNPALELNDERNLLIDELSNYLDIEVVMTPQSIGGGKSIDVLSIKLRESGTLLVDNNKRAKLETEEITASKQVKINLITNDASDPHSLASASATGVDDISGLINDGQINGYLQFLNGKGEFALSTDTGAFKESKGVLYYENMLDALANKFAEIMNDVNREPDVFNPDGTVDTWIEKNLFVNRDTNDKTGITAGNIKISDDWAKATGSYITNTIKPKLLDNDGNPVDTSGAVDNILRMISKFSSKEAFGPDAANPLFKGSFQEFFTYTISKLDLQTKDVETSYETYSTNRYQIEYARSSMSSVDMNEEGVNLLQYSKSYNAAARLMTTLDEMLETLINRI